MQWHKEVVNEKGFSPQRARPPVLGAQTKSPSGKGHGDPAAGTDPVNLVCWATAERPWLGFQAPQAL